MFPAWRYHAVFTDSPFQTTQAEAQHRDHAIIEQVFADWNDGPLAHLPRGHFPANAAWLTLAAITASLTRAAATLASPTCARARGATIRATLISVAARISRADPLRRGLEIASAETPRGRLRYIAALIRSDALIEELVSTEPD